MTAPESASHFTAVAPRTIYRWIEAGKVHFVEPSPGAVLICLDSLARAAAGIAESELGGHL
jgi:predicted site-specific integrase-resolvase